MIAMKIVLLQLAIAIAIFAKLLQSEYRIYAVEGIKMHFRLFHYSAIPLFRPLIWTVRVGSNTQNSFMPALIAQTLTTVYQIQTLLMMKALKIKLKCRIITVQ